MKTDILVIGGGPAGLAAALAARRRGFEVMVADRAFPPIDKACGEGIMPDGLAAALGLGLDLRAEGYPFRGIRFCRGQRSIHSDFPSGVGRGVRRTTLHSLMVERALHDGVDTRWGVPVEFEGDRVLVDGQAVSAQWIVGADGGQSAVRRWAGLDEAAHESRRFGFRRHYQIAPWSEFMEIHWGAGCQLYLTPVGTGQLCVVLISRNPRIRLDSALHQFPEVAERLRSASLTGPERGGVTVTRRLQAVARGRVALIGDASGSVDAITGEGLCLLFQHSVALADACAAGDLSLYNAAHRRILRRPRFMASLMLTLDRSAALCAMSLRAMSDHPNLFAAMLRLHVGQFA